MQLLKTSRYYAGHFVLRGMTSEKLTKLIKALDGKMDWTPQGLDHANIGWNAASRKFLQNCFDSINNRPDNRDGLPPHRYFQSKANKTITAAELKSAFEGLELIRTPQFHERALTTGPGGAQEAWNNNDKI